MSNEKPRLVDGGLYERAVEMSKLLEERRTMASEADKCQHGNDRSICGDCLDAEVMADPVARAAYYQNESKRLRVRCRRLERERDDAASVIEVLARGVGTLQAGHEAPWGHVDDGHGGFVIEDNYGRSVMEVQEGEWDVPAGDDEEGFEERELQAMCAAVNLADEVSAALCKRPGGISTTPEMVSRAAALVRDARKAAKV